MSWELGVIYTYNELHTFRVFLMNRGLTKKSFAINNLKKTTLSF